MIVVASKNVHHQKENKIDMTIIRQMSDLFTI
jgi:hypothetical protein